MKIALAQIQSIKGDIDKNSLKHQYYINEAAAHGADLIVFPELSLTGYEPGLSRQLAMNQNDERFEVFQTLCDENAITICIGVPLSVESGVEIGMLIFQPQKSSIKYSKQILHDDELPFFVQGKTQIALFDNQFKLIPAICYEALQPEHLSLALSLGAKIYLASVDKPEHGLSKAMDYFPNIAKNNQITVLMVNSVGPSDNFISYGLSSAWNTKGELIGQLDHEREGLLILDIASGEPRINYL